MKIDFLQQLAFLCAFLNIGGASANSIFTFRQFKIEASTDCEYGPINYGSNRGLKIQARDLEDVCLIKVQDLDGRKISFSSEIKYWNPENRETDRAQKPQPYGPGVYFLEQEQGIQIYASRRETNGLVFESPLEVRWPDGAVVKIRSLRSIESIPTDFSGPIWLRDIYVRDTKLGEMGPVSFKWNPSTGETTDFRATTLDSPTKVTPLLEGAKISYLYKYLDYIYPRDFYAFHINFDTLKNEYCLRDSNYRHGRTAERQSYGDCLVVFSDEEIARKKSGGPEDSIVIGLSDEEIAQLTRNGRRKKLKASLEEIRFRLPLIRVSIMGENLELAKECFDAKPFVGELPEGFPRRICITDEGAIFSR